MSEISCTACQELRESAPDFAINGTTEAVCNSLAENTGLDANNGHDDATDLHLANDCYVGRMKDEVDAYDTCDWKPFMKLFIRNLYEVLKAIICSIRGIWEKIAELEGGSESFCETSDMLFELALHRLHGVRHTRVNEAWDTDGGAFMCNTVTATFCGKTAIVDMVALATGVGTTSGVTNGDILYTIEKADVVPNQMHESTWNGIMQYGFMQPLATVGGRYTVYAVAAERQEYPGKLSIAIHSTVGPTATASGGVATIQNAPRFFIISG